MENKKFCTECGAGISAEHKFCASCGTNLMSNSPNSSNIKKKLTTKEMVFMGVGFVTLISVLSVFGYQSQKDEQKGFALSGAAGGDAQPMEKPQMPKQEEPVEQPLEKLVDKHTVEKITAEIQAFEKETKSATKKEMALHLAEKFLSMQLFSRAAEYYEKASQVASEKKEQIDLLTKSANIFHDSKHYTKAYALYEKILVMDESNSNVRVDYALALIENGQMMQGVQQMKKAVEFSPKHQKANLNLGILYSQINRIEEAKKYWRIAMELDEKSEAGKYAKTLLTNVEKTNSR